MFVTFGELFITKRQQATVFYFNIYFFREDKTG